jgi:hypothetical protein
VPRTHRCDDLSTAGLWFSWNTLPAECVGLRPDLEICTFYSSLYALRIIVHHHPLLCLSDSEGLCGFSAEMPRADRCGILKFFGQHISHYFFTPLFYINACAWRIFRSASPPHTLARAGATHFLYWSHSKGILFSVTPMLRLPIC